MITTGPKNGVLEIALTEQVPNKFYLVIFILVNEF